MKRLLLSLSTITWSSIVPLSVVACTNSDVNEDGYHPSNDVVDLADCRSLFIASDLTYSFLTVTKEVVALKILSVLKYNIRDLIQVDYSIAFQSKDGKQVDQINIVNDYNIILIASQNSNLLTGSLILNLSVIDDRIDINQINYDSDKWFLSSRNTIADLFTKFEMMIYLVVQDASYRLGDFLQITVKHNDEIYTKSEDEHNMGVLDVSNSYIISATTDSQNPANRYIIGALDPIETSATDQRQSVSNLTEQIFNDYQPDNSIDTGKTFYQSIRNIINKLYTLDSSQSDFDIFIKSNDDILGNDSSRLKSLKYNITIDASKSKYLKDVSPNLTIGVTDNVIHLNDLSIDTTIFKPDIATQAKTLKSEILNQIAVVSKLPGAEKYLIVNLTQDGLKITDDEKYLDPTNIEINIVPNEAAKRQYFGGNLDINLSVVDNRIDLEDSATADAINKAINSIGYSTLSKLSDVKTSVLTMFQELTKDSNPNISQHIKIADLNITLDGYSNDSEQLHEAADVSLHINANPDSRYIKNNLKPVNVNINFVREKNVINIIPMAPTEFIDYDDNGNSHVMAQVDNETVAIYDQDLTTIKYEIAFSTEKNTILDYKVSQDGDHDFWVIQTKIDDTHFKIDYYIDNVLKCTSTFKGYSMIASINKYSQFLYVRPDSTQEHKGIGDLYQMNSTDKTVKMNLLWISKVPFVIDMIRSSNFGQVYIQSKNQIYMFDEDFINVDPIIIKYDITNDYFFDFDDQNNIYELRKEGLYINNKMANNLTPNPNLLYNVDNYKFISNLTVDKDNNYYYLYRDFVNKRYSVVKNQEVVFTVTDGASFYQYLKVSSTGNWELTIGSKIYTNGK